jgi:hypothetical protein
MQSSRMLPGILVGVFLVAAVTQSARAVSLHPGDSVTYNFDFTGQASPPPYTSFTLSHFGFANNDPVADRVTYDIFGELNGGGTNVWHFDSYQVFGISLFNASPETLDGVYSIRLTGVIGDYDVVSASAQAFNGSIQPAAEILGVLSVPEPASLVLFGTALGIAALRRRRA